MTVEEQRSGGEQRAERGEQGTNDADVGAAASAAQPRPPRPLLRSLPSDPDLAKRVLSVPDSAISQVTQILLNEKHDSEDASLIAEFLSGDELEVDATINQFLRAVGGTDAVAAVKRLLATLRWRRDAAPGTTACQTCLSDPGSHYQHVIGKGEEGRKEFLMILFFSRFSRAHDDVKIYI